MESQAYNTPQDLHLDIETYSSVSLKDAGVYKYIESIDFEILMVAYAFGDDPVQIVDLAQGEILPKALVRAIKNPKIRKHAHNATFERLAFRAYKTDTPASVWYCSMVKSGYCGYPLSLRGVSEAMGLGGKGKDTAGDALIRFFSCPVKPTKKNGQRTRNFYYHDPDKWEQFKQYCKQDVTAERNVLKRLRYYTIPAFEREMYILDQKINDKGILIDLNFVKQAIRLDDISSVGISEQMKSITGLDNPNSAARLKNWLGLRMGRIIKSLAKDIIPELIEETEDGTVKDVLRLRTKASKTSIKKYHKMVSCVCDDARAHGLLQFYGASRTGRWAGRLVQLQNLPQNHIDDLEGAKAAVSSGNFDLVAMLYDDISAILSQLIRTAFIAKEGYTFVVADFSAIEARVIAWLAGEQWRLKVFNTHGKIYETSASMMFKVPMDQITKGSDFRNRGKVAELALGYQGASGALTSMIDQENAKAKRKNKDSKDIILSETEKQDIVTRWRAKSPAIVNLWKSVETSAKRALRSGGPIIDKHKGLVFNMEKGALTVVLPSGRKLFYQRPRFGINKFGKENLQYLGMNQETHKWGHIDTYGGKLTENIVQAIARDLLAYSMQKLDQEGFDIVMHVHDEAICEVPLDDAQNALNIMCQIMGKSVDWARDLPLTADGYITPFYKKD
jgi:DNA polymerase